jgi:hypothetical protein
MRQPLPKPRKRPHQRPPIPLHPQTLLLQHQPSPLQHLPNR